MSDESSVKPKPGWRSLLLGSFILFQLIYLPLSNFIQFVPREMPPQHGEFDIRVQREGSLPHVRPIQQSINVIGMAIDRWGEFSGQVQAWSLFAPDFASQSIFPIVDCYCQVGWNRSQDPPLIARIPADPYRYFRLPDGYDRLFSYEFLLCLIYLHYSDESLAKNGVEWQKAVRERIRDQHRSLESYFRWSMVEFKSIYPGRPTPTEMILSVLIMPSPKPGQEERPPTFEVPLARWHPRQEPEPGFLSIEAYDPVGKQFVPVSADGANP